MFGIIRKIFGIKKEKESLPQDSKIDVDPISNVEDRIRWLDKESSPFGIPGVDCFEFTQTMASGCGDKSVIASFLELRYFDGKDLIGKFPEGSVSIATDLEYKYTGDVVDGVLRKAEEMENKWDIYLYSNRIYFCRSWTGDLFYVVEFCHKDERVHVEKIHAKADIVKEGEEFVKAQVDYLFKYFLLGMVVPHPLVKDTPLNLHAIALMSFSFYGRDCCFATYEDTVAYKRSDYGLTD